MLKRLLGAALRARTYWSQCREIVLRALTLNLMIVALIELFYRAKYGGFSSLEKNSIIETAQGSAIAGLLRFPGCEI